MGDWPEQDQLGIEGRDDVQLRDDKSAAVHNHEFDSKGVIQPCGIGGWQTGGRRERRENRVQVTEENVVAKDKQLYECCHGGN